jgi:hypothetical protein
VMGLLEQRELQLVTYAEGRWGLMDLVACVKGSCQSPSSYGFEMPMTPTS